MTKAETLKNEILKQYKSVRQFAIELGIPYSTLATALDDKLDGMAYGTVIKMCDTLKLNPIDFTPLSSSSKTNRILSENRIVHYYNKLNKTGRQKMFEILEDITMISKYTD